MGHAERCGLAPPELYIDKLPHELSEASGGVGIATLSVGPAPSGGDPLPCWTFHSPGYHESHADLKDEKPLVSVHNPRFAGALWRTDCHHMPISGGLGPSDDVINGRFILYTGC